MMPFRCSVGRRLPSAQLQGPGGNEGAADKRCVGAAEALADFARGGEAGIQGEAVGPPETERFWGRIKLFCGF